MVAAESMSRQTKQVVGGKGEVDTKFPLARSRTFE